MAPFRDDRYEIAEDATIKFMDKLKNGIKDGTGRRSKDEKLIRFEPQRLATMVRFELVAILYNKQTKFNDEITSFDDYLEDTNEKASFTDLFHNEEQSLD